MKLSTLPKLKISSNQQFRDCSQSDPSAVEYSQPSTTSADKIDTENQSTCSPQISPDFFATDHSGARFYGSSSGPSSMKRTKMWVFPNHRKVFCSPSSKSNSKEHVQRTQDDPTNSLRDNRWYSILLQFWKKQSLYQMPFICFPSIQTLWCYKNQAREWKK